ncbi:MAG: hypothetical protein FRX48_05588 [Lasallia pustulata]|uniref:Uncharacterized protein n=1 Tax=Lasallia pustulata TaxID=136370 RepID=A0A5M8PL17_9LECA|nr:MAG: hypothetical protein FRX48_05588 [Lasallia pustulata]
MDILPYTSLCGHDYPAGSYLNLKTTADLLSHNLKYREFLLLRIQAQTYRYQRPHAEIHRVYADLRELEKNKHLYSESLYMQLKDRMLDCQARQRMGMELFSYDVRCLRRELAEVKKHIADLEKALEKELAAEKAKRSSEGDEAPQA